MPVMPCWCGQIDAVEKRAHSNTVWQAGVKKPVLTRVYRCQFKWQKKCDNKMKKTAFLLPISI